MYIVWYNIFGFALNILEPWLSWNKSIWNNNEDYYMHWREINRFEITMMTYVNILHDFLVVREMCVVFDLFMKIYRVSHVFTYSSQIWKYTNIIWH